MYYSKKTGGFYMAEVHGDSIPADAVEITRERHAELMDGQGRGLVIAPGRGGFPELQEPAPLTLEQVLMLRQAAYAVESDPLKNEAEFNAIKGGTKPDYSAWLAKVEEIKQRLPKPEGSK